MAETTKTNDDDAGTAHATAAGGALGKQTIGAAAEPTDEEDAPKGERGKSLGNFEITHYTFALESDPKHKDSPKVSAPGLPGASRSPSETGSATTTRSAPAAGASSAAAGRSSRAVIREPWSKAPRSSSSSSGRSARRWCRSRPPT